MSLFIEQANLCLPTLQQKTTEIIEISILAFILLLFLKIFFGKK